jgi:hypothetical protein
MADVSTEVAIATQTLGSAASSITFSSIPSTYTDLRVTITGLSTTNNVNMCVRFNGDTGSNYSYTQLYGNSSSASSGNSVSQTTMYLSAGALYTATPTFYSFDTFSYTGSTYKTSLTTESGDTNGSGYVNRQVCLWRSTSAITTILLYPSSGNFATGFTATLWGIL